MSETPSADAADFEAGRAAFLAGVQAFEAGDLARAETLFLEALRRVPGRTSALVNLAAVRHRLGRPQEALAALDQALAGAPDDLAAWFHRGQLLQQLGRPGDALGSYERVLALEPHHGAAWSQRGGLLKDMGRLAEAAHSFRQALAHGGDVEMNRYFLASVLPQEAAGPDAEAAPAPPSAPARYVEALFDSYADGFDEHLVGKLGYRTPQLIAQMLPGVLGALAGGGSQVHGHATGAAPGPTTAQAPARARWHAALDLGCGTGLMGPLLAPHCEALDGVDLSSLMLGKARALGCYRHLVHAEIAGHLQETPERYELVVAADVFVYIGDLEPVFAGVARVLAPGGLFAFSVEEAGEGTGRYELRPSSRYAHREAYLRQLAETQGFDVRSLTRATLRHEQRVPIGGLLVLLSRR